VLYGEISLSTAFGVNFILQSSNVSCAETFQKALADYASNQSKLLDNLPSRDEPVVSSPDEANEPNSQFGSRWGWTVSTLVAMFFLGAFSAFPPQTATPTESVKPEPAPIMIPAQYQNNCPRFEVIRSKSGLPTPLVLSQQVTKQQIESLAWHLRKATREWNLIDCPVTMPTDFSWENGTILIYRGKRFAQESRLSPPPKKTHHVALFRWSHIGSSLDEEAVVVQKDRNVRLF